MGTLTHIDAMKHMFETEEHAPTHIINAATHLWAAYQTALRLNWYRTLAQRYMPEGAHDVLSDFSEVEAAMRSATVPRFLIERKCSSNGSPWAGAERSSLAGIVDDTINAVFGTQYDVHIDAAERHMPFVKAGRSFIAGYVLGVASVSSNRRGLKRGEVALPHAVSKDGMRVACSLVIGSQLCPPGGQEGV
jgi:hypothetical protein